MSLKDQRGHNDRLYVQEPGGKTLHPVAVRGDRTQVPKKKGHGFRRRRGIIEVPQSTHAKNSSILQNGKPSTTEITPKAREHFRGRAIAFWKAKIVFYHQ